MAWCGLDQLSTIWDSVVWCCVYKRLMRTRIGQLQVWIMISALGMSCASSHTSLA